MPRFFIFALLALSFTTGALVMAWKPKERPATAAVLHTKPPNSIIICGIEDHPCVTYTVSYHQPTEEMGNHPGDGFTDYQAKTISIASSKDPVKNVQVLVHEVYHAALWERGFKSGDKWELHQWIYFSEGPFSMVLHDNPDFLQYIVSGY